MMKQIGRVHYFIDPQIKNLDKELFHYFDSAMIQENFQNITSDIFETDTLIALLVEAPQETKDNHIYLKYEHANLNFLTELKPQGTDVFTVEQVTDLEENLTSLITLIKQFQRKFIQELLSENYQKLEKSLSKIKKTLSPEEQNLLLEFTSELYLARPSQLSEIKVLHSYQKIKENFDVSFHKMRIHAENAQFIVLMKDDELVEIESENLTYAYFIYLILNEYFHQIDLTQQKDAEWKEWKEVLNSLKTPLCIIGGNNEIEYINSSMSDLAVSQKSINELQHKSFFEHNETVFQVEKYQLSGKNSLLLFNTSEEEFRPTSTDLGIISSSIAHELNNPLGGLLASLDVLLLEELDEESVERITEMKKVVLRCKKLVETFLGFSRSEVDLKKWEGLDLSIEDSIQQANELIRFRLVENQVHINVSMEKVEKYQHLFNPHILSMIFYLIFGELLTSFSHYTLLEADRNSLFNIKINEYSESVEIHFEKQIKLNLSFFRSRLFKHLLEIESLKIDVESGFIRIFYR